MTKTGNEHYLLLEGSLTENGEKSQKNAAF
jgi:hypothetical protein